MQPSAIVMPEAALTFNDVVAILDEATGAVGMTPIETNSLFVKDQLSADGYRLYHLQKPSPAYVDLSVEVSASQITFHVDRVSEAVEWGPKQFADRERTVAALSSFLSGYLLIEHLSARTTRMTLFRGDGEQVWSAKRTDWPGNDVRYERHLFLPLNSIPQAA